MRRHLIFKAFPNLQDITETLRGLCPASLSHCALAGSPCRHEVHLPPARTQAQDFPQRAFQRADRYNLGPDGDWKGEAVGILMSAHLYQFPRYRPVKGCIECARLSKDLALKERNYASAHGRLTSVAEIDGTAHYQKLRTTSDDCRIDWAFARMELEEHLRLHA